MRSPIRVLLLIKCLDAGGAERLIVDTVASRDRDSFHYEVAFVLDHMDALVPEIESIGVAVHRLGGSGNYDLRWLPRLRSLLATGRYDIVHTHLPLSAGLTRLVTRTLPAARRPRLVYTEHCQQSRYALPVRWLTRTTMRFDDRIIAVSEAARSSVPMPERDRVEVLLHGIDRAGRMRVRTDPTDVRAEFGIRPDEVVVTTIANLRPQKGYPLLLEAARRLADERLAVRFLAAGTGPLAHELACARDRLALASRFTFLGYHEDIPGLLRASDVFVLSSDYEGMPVSVMEAMTLGVPVVATAVGGLPQLVTDGHNGRLVPPGDVDALAAALRQLVIDAGIRQQLGEAGRALSCAFDVGRATRRLEEIYRELVCA